MIVLCMLKLLIFRIYVLSWVYNYTANQKVPQYN